MKRIFLLLNLIVIVFLGCQSPDNDTFVVACNLPITGYLSTYGESVRDGINFAMESSLKDSMKINNVNIEYDFQDNKSSSKDAVNTFLKQKMNAPNIYMSGITEQTYAIFDNVDELNIPHFVWAFTPLFLKDRVNDNYFRTWLNLGIEAESYLKYIDSLDKKPLTISLLYLNVSGVQMQFNDYLIPELKKRDIDIILNQCYDVAQTDFKNEILKIKQSNPDFMIVNGFKGNMISIVKGLKNNKMVKTNNIICSFDLMDAQDDLSNDFLADLCLPVPEFELTKSTINKEWSSKFVNRFHRNPRYTDAFAYDCAYAIYKAVLMTNKNKNSLPKNLRRLSFEGVAGSFKFDAFGDIITPVKICKFDSDGNKHIIE